MKNILFDSNQPIEYKEGQILNINGIRKILEFKFLNKSLEEIRDLWMLSFFLMGLDIREILVAYPEDIVPGVFLVHSKASGDKIPIPLEDCAKDIIDKYEGKYYAIKQIEADYTPQRKDAVKKATRLRFNFNSKLEMIRTALEIKCNISFENIRLIWFFAAKEAKLEERPVNIINNFMCNPHRRFAINGNIETIAVENLKLINTIFKRSEDIKDKSEVEYPIKLKDGSLLYYSD